MTEPTDETVGMFCESKEGFRLALSPVPETVAAIEWTTITPNQEQALMQATADYLETVHNILASHLASC